MWSTRERGGGEWFVRRNKANLKIINSTNKECMNKETLCIALCRVTKSYEILMD